MIDKFLEINSIDPDYWGKSGWIFLNSIALTYNFEFREKYKQFILQLPFILPCKSCGHNLKKNIDTLDEALESKESFIKWLINIRNEVYIDNKTYWKQKNIKETFNEIFYSNSSNVNNYWWLFFSILVLIILIYLFRLELNKKQ